MSICPPFHADDQLAELGGGEERNDLQGSQHRGMTLANPECGHKAAEARGRESVKLMLEIEFSARNRPRPQVRPDAKC